MTEHGARLLIVHSEADEGLDYLHLVLGDNTNALNENEKLQLEIIKEANHTFTVLWSQEHLLSVIRNWILEFDEN